VKVNWCRAQHMHIVFGWYGSAGMSDMLHHNCLIWEQSKWYAPWERTGTRKVTHHYAGYCGDLRKLSALVFPGDLASSLSQSEWLCIIPQQWCIEHTNGSSGAGPSGGSALTDQRTQHMLICTFGCVLIRWAVMTAIGDTPMMMVLSCSQKEKAARKCTVCKHCRIPSFCALNMPPSHHI